MIGGGGRIRRGERERVGSCSGVKGCHGDMVRLAQKKESKRKEKGKVLNEEDRLGRGWWM